MMGDENKESRFDGIVSVKESEAAEAAKDSKDQSVSDLASDETDADGDGEESETSKAKAKDETSDAEGEKESDSSQEDNSESDDEDGDDDDLEAKERPKKSKGWQRRIKKFRRMLSEKDQRIAFLESQIAAKEAPQKTDNPVIEDSDQPKRPNPDDFETNDEYIEALTDWKIEQRELEKERKAKAESAKRSLEEKQAAFAAQVKEFKKEVDDFDEVIAEVDDIIVSPALCEALFASEMGAQVVYELAKNRDEFARINKLGVVAAAKEIGKIEALLTKKKESPTVKKTTSAPPPPKPVGRSSEKAVRRSIYDPDISQADFEELRAEQERRRKGA